MKGDPKNSSNRVVSAAGAFCRYWVGLWTAGKLGAGFDYGTLLTNLAGSFILGLFLALNMDRGLFTPNARFFMAAGWCASFTTYSTFSWETFRYLQSGGYRSAALNAGLTFFGCLLATWVGVEAARFM